MDDKFMFESNLLNKLMNRPRDKVDLDPYYRDEIKIIRIEIDSLLGFQTTDEQFVSMIHAWHYRDLLLSRCNQYNFTILRDRIDKFIKQLESVILDEQESTISDVNFLCPLIDEMNIGSVASLNFLELERLKKIKSKLSRSNSSKGAKGYLTKRAYFELFFIGELLGLGITRAGEKNDLITLAEIITKQTKPNRARLSEHYQKYELFKKITPEVNSLLHDGKRRYVNNPQFPFALQQFQTEVYPKIPIASSK